MDPRESLISKVGEYTGERDDMLRRTMFFFGNRLKAMDNPAGRFLVSNISTRFMGYMIVRGKLFGVEKKPDMTLEEIALAWLKPSLFFNIPTEIGEVTEDRIEILRPECTVGFDNPAQRRICRASMNMDMEIIRRLGGRLTVTETILEGAQKCRHILEKA